MFSDCPSIRMSVRPDFFQLRDKYNYLMEFHQIWSSWFKLDVTIEYILGEIRPTSRVKGQSSN